MRASHLALAFAALGVATYVSCRVPIGRSAAAIGPRSDRGVVFSPDRVELRSRAGGSSQANVVIRNLGPRPALILAASTSCPCVRITSPSLDQDLPVSLPLYLGPGDFAEWNISHDPSEDPDFRGTLEVELTGLSEGQDVVCRGQVRVVVPPGP
jgi:hypothetical protein